MKFKLELDVDRARVTDRIGILCGALLALFMTLLTLKGKRSTG